LRIPLRLRDFACAFISVLFGSGFAGLGLNNEKIFNKKAIKKQIPALIPHNNYKILEMLDILPTNS